jgi:hypothetical protein
MRAFINSLGVLLAAAVFATASVACAADGENWSVSKSSGEVWVSASGVQPASLKQEDVLKAGDTIRTGRTGRVLLKRGEETILISPNSVVGVPAEKKEGLATTIVQQAGSILLDVEKRNVKHFEVETPFLAAVVKGTQFRVTINAGSTSVDVIRGQVEVADFKSGQIAQVMPGQHATAFAHGKAGLALTGSGTFSPIEQGKPRAPNIERVPVPRNGLSSPRHAANERSTQAPRQSGVHVVRPGVTRISSSIGEVRLNVHRATHGLARDNSPAHGGSRDAKNDTISNPSDSGASSTAANNGQGNVANGAANLSNSGAGVSATIAASSGSDGGGKGKDKDKGNNGNGPGNGNGANGNGKGNGPGPGPGPGHGPGPGKGPGHGPGKK